MQPASRALQCTQDSYAADPWRMLFKEIQQGSSPLFEAVGVVVAVQGRFLLLKRRTDKPHPGRWGIPSGKLRRGEKRVAAAVRELYEETKLLVSAERLRLVGTYHIVTDDMSFLYTLYSCTYPEFPETEHDPGEHTRINWFTAQDSSRLALMPELSGLLREAFGVLQPRPVQLSLFTGLPEAPGPSVWETESLVRDSMPGGATAVTQGKGKSWVTTLGPPACGKRRAFRNASSGGTAFAIFPEREPASKSGVLTRCLERVFVEDDRSSVLRLQLEMLLLRFRQALLAPPQCVVVGSNYDVLAYSRALLAVGLLSSEEYGSFYRYYVQLQSVLPSPLGVVCFDTCFRTLRTRMTRRAKRAKCRQHELYYTDEYVTALLASFADVAGEVAQLTETIRIDASGATLPDISEKVPVIRRVMQME